MTKINGYYFSSVDLLQMDACAQDSLGSNCQATQNTFLRFLTELWDVQKELKCAFLINF